MNIPFTIPIHVLVFIMTFILSLAAGPILIPILRRLKFSQTVRDDGPATHLIKTGTPTFGGLIFLIPILLMTVFYIRSYPGILPLVFVTLGFGLIGFIDDFIKVVKKRKDGLDWKQKSFGLLSVAAVFAFYVNRFLGIGTDIVVPFTGMYGTIDIAWFFIPFVILTLYLTTNAVNLTDGLDGLAAGTTLIVMAFFTIVAMKSSEWDYIKVFSAMVTGGCLGFLTFNIHPARVIMGDTGSLALGGAVGAAAIVMKLPLLIPIVGIIYAVETLSVVIQVTSFKTRGKRVLKMAPIHHHFELSGWKETKVVYVFWTVTVLFCLAGYAALYTGTF